MTDVAKSDTITDTMLRATGARVIRTEAEGLQQLATRVDDSFSDACCLILAGTGRVIVTGIGKSGHIGRKLAATLASTGTPAFFVHAAEANHGDMGMITGGDILIALSNSGETSEIIMLLPLLKRLGVTLITLTGNPQSRLAKAAAINLDVGVAQEACPLGLAPTASTTAALAMGDALAITLLHARGFSAEDFAFSHPAGLIGRRLLLQVSEIMHTGDSLPRVTPNAVLSTALFEMTRSRLGLTAVVAPDGTLCGIFTDGDLRRALCDLGRDIHRDTISQLMTVDCVTVAPDTLAVEGLRIMRAHRINALLVVGDQSELLGALNMHDMLQAGLLCSDESRS